MSDLQKPFLTRQNRIVPKFKLQHTSHANNMIPGESQRYAARRKRHSFPSHYAWALAHSVDFWGKNPDKSS